jgi:hypothetical protein
MEVSGQIHATAALPPGKDPPIHIGWVITRAGMDAVKQRKISYPCRELNPDNPACSPFENCICFGHQTWGGRFNSQSSSLGKAHLDHWTPKEVRTGQFGPKWVVPSSPLYLMTEMDLRFKRCAWRNFRRSTMSNIYLCVLMKWIQMRNVELNIYKRLLWQVH